MFSFAIKTLLVDRRKLLIAMTGVVFSLVLVNVQGGMFLGLIRKSTILIDESEADIWVGHRGVQNADITADIPLSWLYRIRGVPGVQRAEPYIVAAGMLQLPEGDFEGVLVVGSDTASMLGGPWSFAEGDVHSLRSPDAITIDRLDDSRLGNPQIGDVVEINHQRARVAAKTDGIVGFITTPYVFTTLNAARAFGKVEAERCSYFLIQTDGQANMQDVVAELQQRLPDADVYTAADFSWKTRMYWITRTGLGMSFGGSTLLGLIVGLVMVAQSMYAFVLDHLDQYAALKAMGASDRQLLRILMTQGLTIAALGCIVGHAVSFAVCSLLASPRLSIVVHPGLLAFASCLAATICVISVLIPFARIRNVDPVTVLQA